jgi:hypothetical protein
MIIFAFPDEFHRLNTPVHHGDNLFDALLNDVERSPSEVSKPWQLSLALPRKDHSLHGTTCVGPTSQALP